MKSQLCYGYPKEKQRKIKERYDSFSDIKLVSRQGKIYGKPPYKPGILCGLKFKEPQKIKIERGKDELITIIADFEKIK